jgi:hypothetical protein
MLFTYSMNIVTHFDKISHVAQLKTLEFHTHHQCRLGGFFVCEMNLLELERLRDVLILNYTSEGMPDFGVKVYWEPRAMIQLFRNGEFLLYGYTPELLNYRQLLLDIGGTLERLQIKLPTV